MMQDESLDLLDWNAARIATIGKLITLLHSRSQGCVMNEMSTRVLCRAAESALRRFSVTPKENLDSNERPRI